MKSYLLTSKHCFVPLLGGECLIRESLEIRIVNSVLIQEYGLQLSSGWLSDLKLMNHGESTKQVCQVTWLIYWEGNGLTAVAGLGCRPVKWFLL